MDKGDILIVGAGLGGLTAALALQKNGLRVRVFEQAAEVSEVGAGIMLTPNASRLLLQLGLGPVLDRNAVIPTSTIVRDGVSGAVLSDTHIGALFTQRHGAPYYIMHRADLHRGLREAVLSHDPACLFLGHGFTSYQLAEDSVTVRFANGHESKGRVLAGADGIKSRVRQSVAPGAPKFTGNIAWRGLVPIEMLPKDIRQEPTIWVGPGRHFVQYAVKNGSLMNYVAIAEQSVWQDDGWMLQADPRDALACFSGWHPDLREVIAKTPARACFKWGLFDHNPLPHWTQARVALLGDAAHPMLPFMAQGAAMAIEDAVVLSQALRREGDVVRALELYQAERLPRTSWVQDQSRRNQHLYHRSRAGGDFDADRALRAERLYDYDAFAV
jgi:salicylate hydroxylase